MKNHIEHLMYSDESRLPLLAIVPDILSEQYVNALGGGRASGRTTVESILGVRSALKTRLENVRARSERVGFLASGPEIGTQLEGVSNDGTVKEKVAVTAASIGEEEYENFRTEVRMLEIALDWIALQEKR
ncbi:MAG: hypothetical protein KDD60_11380 [Bdellovibrionales bacterium]|nr:hypothetical protein [Bdellovibrionales bacterium]